MAMREQQERRSPPMETTQTASNEPELMTTSGPLAGGSSAATSMATAGDMVGSGAVGEEERAAEGGGLDIVRSPSAWAALLSAASSTSKVLISSINASPQFQRKPRTHVHRAAAPSPHWLGFRLPVLPAAPAKRKGKAKKKRDTPCVLCGAAETPLWRTWPTDRRVALCNACGIQVRTLPPGAVLPELVYLTHLAVTTTVVSEVEQPVAPAQEIQPVKDSPGAALPKQVRVNLPPLATAATTVVPEIEQPVAPAQEIQPVKGDSPGAALPKQVRVNLPPPAMSATTVVPEIEQPVAPAQEFQPAKGDSLGAALPKQVRLNLPPPAMAATTVVPELEQPRPQEIQESESQPDSPLDSMLDTEVYLVKRTSPRREKSPPPPPSPLPPPPTAEPEPVPGNENDKEPARRCLHCGATSTRQWRMGPEGEKTLCNPCGVRYMRGGLVPEYRPKESPSFDGSVHSNVHSAVLQIRQLQDNPVAPAEYQRIRARRKRRNGNGQQQPAQVGKKRKEQNLPVLPVREKSKRNKAKEQHRQPPQPAATTQLPAGNDMLLNLDLNMPPPPPPALLHAGGDIERGQRLPPELLQHTTGNMEMEEQDLPPPPPLALPLPHAGGELMRDEDEPMSPLDPWLLEGPWAPMIFEDDEPVEVIVIDDD